MTAPDNSTAATMTDHKVMMYSPIGPTGMASVVAATDLSMLEAAAISVDKTNKNRCVCCRKKLTLTDVGCGKCSQRFCSLHRLPEDHNCTCDLKAAGLSKLKEQLVRVTAAKVTAI